MNSRIWIGAVLCAATAAGCVTGSSQPVIRYTLEPEIQVQAMAPSDKALSLRPLRDTRRSRDKIEYLEDGLRLGRYEYAEWAEPPAEMVFRGLTDALIATGRFVDVARATELTRPELLMTGDLREFHIDRTVDPWQAVCEVRLELREGIERKLVWAETLTAREPLARNDVSESPLAMSRAVGGLASRAAAEAAAAVPTE